PARVPFQQQDRRADSVARWEVTQAPAERRHAPCKSKDAPPNKALSCRLHRKPLWPVLCRQEQTFSYRRQAELGRRWRRAQLQAPSYECSYCWRPPHLPSSRRNVAASARGHGAILKRVASTRNHAPARPEALLPPRVPAVPPGTTGRTEQPFSGQSAEGF